MRRLAAAALALLVVLAPASATAAPTDGRCAEPGTGRIVHCHHVVQRGEWLWSIARQNLRDDFGLRRPNDRTVHRRSDEILALNRAVVGTDPNHLRPGAVLRLYPWVDAPAAPPAGPLDRSFGSQGLATATPGPGYTDAAAVALDPQGRIVTAGLQSGAFGVFRFTTPGRLDPTFGTGGNVRTPIGSFARATAVAVQADGRIVVAGSNDPSPATVHADVTLVRYLPTGALDPSFGGDGIVTTRFPGYASATALALDDLGRIVVAGSADPSEQSQRADVAVLRYLPDGSLDPTFGAGGRVTTDVAGGVDVADGVAIAPDGRILVAGTAGRGAEVGGQDGLVARYLPDGRLDASFGGDGTVTTSHSPFDEHAAVRVLADGSVATAGTTVPQGLRSYFVLTRFGADGAVTSSTLTDAGADGDAHGLTVDPAGRFVVVGRAANVAALVRYLPTGAVDPAFGVVRTSFGGERSGAFAVTVDAGGSLVVAGCTCDGANTSTRGGFEIPSSVVVARYRS